MSVAVSCARIADVILGNGPVKVITPLCMLLILYGQVMSFFG